MATTTETATRFGRGAGGSSRAARTIGAWVSNIGLGLIGVVILLLIWTAISYQVFSPARLPTPADVGPAMLQLAASGQLLSAFAASLEKIGTGFALAVIVGAPIGVGMAVNRYVRAFFQDLLVFSGNIPGLTYAILALVIFGIDPRGAVLAVALSALPYIILNVQEGTLAIDPRLRTMSKAYGVGWLREMRHILIPAVAPYVFVGFRYAFAYVWKVEAVTEVFGGSSGIGFEIKSAYQSFSILNVLAWAAWFGIFLLIMERLLLVPAERRWVRWRGA